MIIREEQLRQIEAGLREPFLRWATEHVERHFPAQCLLRGPDAVRSLIELGLRRAEGYGIYSGPGIARYLNLMFVFHDDFDRDPAFPWAAKILQDETIDEAVKLQSLLAYALMEFPDKEPAASAARRGS